MYQSVHVCKNKSVRINAYNLLSDNDDGDGDGGGGSDVNRSSSGDKGGGTSGNPGHGNSMDLILG